MTQFIERLEVLIEEVERFFKSLVKVSEFLDKELDENMRKNEEIVQKIIYVCASKEDKEELYQSLKFDTAKSDSSVNEIIAYALYGQFCAKENPNAENNKKYKGKKPEVIFYQEAVAAYAKRIVSTNGQDIDLDIYSAVCKSADMEYEKERKKLSDVEKDDIDTLDFESEETADDMKHLRHDDAMKKLIGKLRDLSAPFLISNEEFQDVDPDEHLKYTADAKEEFYKTSKKNGKEIFTPIKKRKTFWGFNPVVAKECKDLARLLGVNVEMQKNSAYAKNELYCYRAVYGIQAGYIDKFNELGDGLYYRNYKQVVDEMVKAGNPEALVHTPHLDKTWHLFLPYITPEKQKFEDNRFYRLFWLALAYGTVYLGRDEFYYIKRVRRIPTGTYERSEQLLYNGKPISKVNVFELLSALKFDAAFINESEALLEARFAEDCEKATTGSYEGTVFLKGKSEKETSKSNAGKKGKSEKETSESGEGEKGRKIGGLATKQDTNAFTIIIRYNDSPRHSSPEHKADLTATLMHSLLNICCELVKNKYDVDEGNKVLQVGYELCKRIYDASERKSDNGIKDLLQPWKDAWAKNR